MKSNVAHVVYRSLLSQSGHGYPLWIPEPDSSLPHTYQQRGITVGDVGILTERGSFDFLFNIHEVADSSVNDGQVPPGFEPWLPSARDISIHHYIHKARGSVVSSSVSRRLIAGGGFGVEFCTEKDQAAVLVLPHGATGYDAKNRASYEEYARTNAKAWCGYAKSLGRGRTHLYLVTGCDKARSWGAAAFSQPGQTHSVSLQFSADGFAGAGVSFHSSWSHDFGAESRLHPPAPGFLSLEETQCVFTRGFTIAVRQNILSRAIKGDVDVSFANLASPTLVPMFRSSSSSNTLPLGTRLPSPSTQHHVLSDFFASFLALPTRPTIVAKPASDTKIDDSDLEVSISSFPAVSDQFSSPSSIMCNAILEEHDDTDVVIIHDEAWMCLAGLQEANFITRILWPEYTVVKDDDRYATVRIPVIPDISSPPSKTRSSAYIQAGLIASVALKNYLRSNGRLLSSLSWAERSSGSQNDPTWTVDCYIDGVHHGSGEDSDKSIARDIAAGVALSLLKGN